MNSRDDFDKIYSSTFNQSYKLSFCLSASHVIASKVTGEVYNLFYEENMKFKSMEQVVVYLYSQINYQTFKYLDSKDNRSHLYLSSAVINDEADADVIQNNRHFYVNLVNRALDSKALKEVYVMHFFLSLDDAKIAEILKSNVKAVRANLNRARMLVVSEYENSTL